MCVGHKRAGPQLQRMYSVVARDVGKLKPGRWLLEGQGSDVWEKSWLQEQRGLQVREVCTSEHDPQC